MKAKLSQPPPLVSHSNHSISPVTPAELVPLDNHGSQFDLTLLMSASGANLLGSLKYSTDLFDRTTIQVSGPAFRVAGGHRRGFPAATFGPAFNGSGGTRPGVIAIQHGRPFSIFRREAGPRIV